MSATGALRFRATCECGWERGNLSAEDAETLATTGCPACGPWAGHLG